MQIKTLFHLSDNSSFICNFGYREELENCLTQVKQLEQERDKVFAEIEAQEQEENM